MGDEPIDGRYLGRVRNMFDVFIQTKLGKNGTLYCGEKIATYIQFSNFFQINISDNINFGIWKFGDQTLNLTLSSGLNDNEFIYE